MKSVATGLLLGILAGCSAGPTSTGLRGPQPAPVEVPRVPLAAGADFACTLRPGGAVCWGFGLPGWLPSVGPGQAKVVIAGLVALGAGQLHACGITAAGKVRCWGRNDSEQLGEPTATGTHKHAASVVPLPRPALALAGGSDNTCALLEAGAVWCWGGAPFGRRDGEIPTVRPHAVELPGRAIAIAAGGDLACAVLGAGEVHCWGRCFKRGAARRIDDLAGVQSISANSENVCAVNGGGEVRCFTGDSLKPLKVGLEQPARSVSVSRRHACALTRSQEIVCFELAKDGASSGIAAISGSGPASAIAVTRSQGCALSDAAVSCWRMNESRYLPMAQRAKLREKRYQAKRVDLPTRVSGQRPVRLPVVADKYERLAKANEAGHALNRLAKAVKRLDAAAVARLTTTDWTPRGSCCKGAGKGKARSCRADGKTFAHPTWRAVAFKMSGPHHFQYRITVEPGEQRLTLQARADLDCDGTFSLHKLTATREADGSWRLMGPLIYNELE
jgi:Regulator of chromosome condensation (RCC1) repeat